MILFAFAQVCLKIMPENSLLIQVNNYAESKVESRETIFCGNVIKYIANGIGIKVRE